MVHLATPVLVSGLCLYLLSLPVLLRAASRLIRQGGTNWVSFKVVL